MCVHCSMFIINVKHPSKFQLMIIWKPSLSSEITNKLGGFKYGSISMFEGKWKSATDIYISGEWRQFSCLVSPPSYLYLLPRLSFTILHYLLVLSLYYKKRLTNNRIVSFSFELFMLAFFFIFRLHKWDCYVTTTTSPGSRVTQTISGWDGKHSILFI